MINISLCTQTFFNSLCDQNIRTVHHCLIQCLILIRSSLFVWSNQLSQAQTSRRAGIEISSHIHWKLWTCICRLHCLFSSLCLFWCPWFWIAPVGVSWGGSGVVLFWDYLKYSHTFSFDAVWKHLQTLPFAKLCQTHQWVSESNWHRPHICQNI